MVLRVFIWSLQNIHEQITPEMITEGNATTSMDIEIIDEGQQNDNEEFFSAKKSTRVSKEDKIK